MTAENAARGRSNRTRGQAAERNGLAYLRAHGAPNADYSTSGHIGDYVTGVGDVHLEVTLEGWGQIGKKAKQAAENAARLGLDRWCIWKPRRREPGKPEEPGLKDMGRAWAITEFQQYWQRELRILELEHEVGVLRGIIGRALEGIDEAREINREAAAEHRELGKSLGLIPDE